jgi:hypothetical protein
MTVGDGTAGCTRACRKQTTDLGRLEALRQQAIARGWLRRCEADRLNVVAAAVHARRRGDDPCALFVALVRDQRWAVITQEEDRARALLRTHATGPQRQARATAAPERALADDARFVRLAQQVLHQAGWPGDPFMAVHMQDPAWTRTRWERAQAALVAAYRAADQRGGRCGSSTCPAPPKRPGISSEAT